MGGGTGSGTGGSTANPALNCSAAVTPAAMVTNFSDYSATAGRWGDSARLFGAIYGYAGTGSMMTVSVDSTAVDLHFVGTVNPVADGGTNMGYAGGGLQFLACANVASFTGLRFTVSGSNACALELQFPNFAQRPTDQNPPGGCDRTAGSCFNYAKKTGLTVTATASTVTVMFSELSPTLATGELVGLQWQATVPPGVDGGAQTPCAVDFHVDNVEFF
jgi:hypothetical protein